MENLVNFEINITPLIFDLAESVFMAAETVTPNAPATSAIFASNSPVRGEIFLGTTPDNSKAPSGAEYSARFPDAAAPDGA